MWILRGNLNGTYFHELWGSQEACITRREQRLEPKRDNKGFMVHPTGWTAVTRGKGGYE